MQNEKFRIGQVVAMNNLSHATVFRVVEILADGEFKIKRVYGVEITNPFIAAMSNYRIASKEQCRNAGLVAP